VKEDFLVYIPNTFTPNDDGLNDVFMPVGEGISSENYHFMIFNRWGALVYQTQKPGEGWDGKVSGVEAVTGIYTYKLVCKPTEKMKLHEITGSVNLLR
jgi:gliding motility-associated-like protein